MKKWYTIILQWLIFFTIITGSIPGLAAKPDTIPPRYKVTLPEAHVGDLATDTRLLDSYGRLPENIRAFYLSARTVFEGNAEADFTHTEIIEAAAKNNIPLMGGPMLGNVSTDGVTLWMRPTGTNPLSVKVKKTKGAGDKTYVVKPEGAGREQRIRIDGMVPGTEYKYAIYSENQIIAEGGFKTSPDSVKNEVFRLAFGSCFHKIGLHNPNLISQILKREPQAMMILGDIAVDDRRNRINLHQADYLLRDVSGPWRKLAANVPLYTAWDDHDYFDNDLGGIPKGFTEADRASVRDVWQQNWNNPENPAPGIYFNTRIGPAEVIMLDSRSFRDNANRGKYGSFLGREQFSWLKDILKNSGAPFKVISCGTMWSDFITNGKDSWGTWDPETREELFNFIEKEKISGVLLVSGDRHGARGFTLPRPSGFSMYEFQVASLGGVPGPPAMAEDTASQLFGYLGADFVAFGEFTFMEKGDEWQVVFRLINEYGNILEEHTIPYVKLIP